MSVANLAQWGYAQTVAGVWDLGDGLRLTLGIDAPRADRFSFEILGPTTPVLLLHEKASALLDVPPSAGPVERRAPLGVLIASLVPLQRGASKGRPFVRVLRTAYALGAPLGGDDGAPEERTRSGFAAALARRDEVGSGFDLTRVAAQLVDHIAEQPYFSDGEDPRWWELGLIVVPLPPEPPATALPRALLLFVRTDLAGKALALTALLTVGDRLVATATRVLARADDSLDDEDEIDTMEAWT